MMILLLAPCYPAYITRNIYSHNGYNVIIWAENALPTYPISDSQNKS